jgi:hypothetical protein
MVSLRYRVFATAWGAFLVLLGGLIGWGVVLADDWGTPIRLIGVAHVIAGLWAGSGLLRAGVTGRVPPWVRRWVDM